MVYILIKIIINNKCIQVSHLQKAPRDGTKWKFIPTCAWCRIDTQFIWKICNRHKGTVPQTDFFPYVHSKSSNESEFLYYRGKLFEPSLNHIFHLDQALKTVFIFLTIPLNLFYFMAQTYGVTLAHLRKDFNQMI